MVFDVGAGPIYSVMRFPGKDYLFGLLLQDVFTKDEGAGFGVRNKTKNNILVRVLTSQDAVCQSVLNKEC